MQYYTYIGNNLNKKQFGIRSLSMLTAKLAVV